MQTDETGVNDAEQAENQTRRILLKLNSKEWSEPLAIYYVVLAVAAADLLKRGSSFSA